MRTLNADCNASIGNMNEKKEIKYIVTRKNIKNMYFRAKSDGTIDVSANYNVTDLQIKDFIDKNYEKLIRMLEKASKRAENPNETHYLGKVYPVEFKKMSGNYAQFDGNVFTVNDLLEKRYEDVQVALRNCKIDMCFDVFSKINSEVAADFREKGYNIPITAVTIKYMKTLWGSCNAFKHKISICTKLADYPLKCVYSVYYHEYMHYKYSGHTAAFYKELNSIFPEYDECAKLLKQ